MANDPTHIPCGDYEGALPEKLVIDGVHWIYISVEIRNGEAFTTIKNSITGKFKTLKNDTILNFIKNKRK